MIKQIQCWYFNSAQRDFRKRSRKYANVLGLDFVSSPSIEFHKSRDCDPSESLGFTNMTNTGFFTALPSLVIMLLRARAGLPRRQRSPVNIAWQSDVFLENLLFPCLYTPFDICLKIILQSLYLQMHQKRLGHLLNIVSARCNFDRELAHADPELKNPSWC